MSREDIKKAIEDGEFTRAFNLAGTDGNATAYYNLGTALLNNNAHGQALAALEKAYRLNPSDPDTSYNFELARKKAWKELGSTLLEDHASTSLEALGSLPYRSQIEGGLGILSLLTVLFWLRTYIRKRDYRSVFFRPIGILGIIVLGLLVTNELSKYYSSQHPLAIAIEKVSLRSGPGKQYQDLGQIVPGQKVRILEIDPHEPQWVQIRISPDQISWVTGISLLRL